MEILVNPYFYLGMSLGFGVIYLALKQMGYGIASIFTFIVFFVVLLTT